jgi:hypothetical protein
MPDYPVQYFFSNLEIITEPGSMIRNLLKEYFCFTRSEKNGTLVLAFIMLLVFLFPYIYNSLKNPVQYTPDPILLQEINDFYNPRPGNEQFTEGRQIPLYTDAEAATPVQAVNPIKKTDINSADTSDLMTVRGIGPVFSRRILRYRALLGGYYDISQLMEVYGFDEKRYHETAPFLWADTTLLVKLKPATDDFRVLLRHPYLEYEQVTEIFNLRNSGVLHSPADLLQSPVFSDSDLKRLLPYMHFE